MDHRLLSQSARTFQPPHGAQERVRRKLLARIVAGREASLIMQARDMIRPDARVSARMWNRILESITPLVHVPLYARLSRPFQWASFAVLVLVSMRLLPLAFVPSHTIAQSSVLVIPTHGQVLFLSNGLWQPIVQETTLTKSAIFQTGDSEATIVLHDDGVVRLAPHTTVALHDLSDRPRVSYHPTLTLHSGKIWVLGLLPSTVDGITVGTAQGDVTVHDGSVSIVSDTTTIVRVWNRHATVNATDGEAKQLLAGERAELSDGTLVVKKIAPALYEDPWVLRQLSADAAHRQEIAQLQQERRAAEAGILPTSSLYTVKRVAEAVDLLLTLGPEARAQKRLDQASTRLNEAAALISQGGTGATIALQEYKDTILSVASGTGGNAVVQSLIEQQVAEATSDVAAQLPSDPGYQIKEMVLQTSAELPESSVKPQDVQGTLFVDAISELRQQVEQGDLASAKDDFTRLESSIAMLPSDLQKEAEASLSTMQLTLGNVKAAEDAEADTAAPDEHPLLRLSPEEVRAYARRIKNRVYLYDEARSQYNQLVLEFHALENNPNRGSILRQLQKELTTGDLPHFVEREIAHVKWELVVGSGKTGL